MKTRITFDDDEPFFEKKDKNPPVIKRSSLVDQICTYLRSRIFDFDLKPGQPVQESKLMKSTGVSRSPIREALRILEGEGLLERNAQKGVIVKNISLREIHETYSILAVLEGLAAEEATDRLGDKDISGLKKLCDEMKKKALLRDYKKWAECNYKFHRIIIKAADNVLLENALKQYRSKTVWFMAFMAASLQEEIFHQSQSEHKEILEAFENRDADRAIKTVKRHIKNAGVTVEKAYRSRGRK